MNIDDLWRDIEEMQEMEDNENDLSEMIAIANAYEEDKKLCEKLIMDFRLKYGIKINIL